MKPVTTQSLAQVTEKLQLTGSPFAFLGGAILPFLLDDSSMVIARPTKDVDVIMEILTRVEFSKLEEQLRTIGFKHDTTQGAPKCRWLLDSITVDVMATHEKAGDGPSEWFAEALENAQPVKLAPGCFAHIITAPYFLATKLNAFFDRGNQDLYGSHDLEDILTVLDGRTTICTEIQNSPEELRKYLAVCFSKLLADTHFLQCLPGHLPSDAASQERAPILLTTIRRISTMTRADK